MSSIYAWALDKRGEYYAINFRSVKKDEIYCHTFEEVKSLLLCVIADQITELKLRYDIIKTSTKRDYTVQSDEVKHLITKPDNNERTKYKDRNF